MRTRCPWGGTFASVFEQQADATLRIQELLEVVLRQVNGISDPLVDPADLSELIGSAMAQVYQARAEASRGASFSDAFTIVAFELERALEMVSVAATDPVATRVAELLAQVLGLGRTAGGYVSATRLPDPVARVVVPATTGEPALLDVARDILTPVLPVWRREPQPSVDVQQPPEPDALHTLEELEAIVAAVPSAPAGGGAQPEIQPRSNERREIPVSASDVLAEYAGVLIEELGVFGLLRQPVEEPTWTGKAKVEERLLARVDAIVACGGQVLPSLVRKLEARPVPDPELTWGLIFLFGSIVGDDMIEEAVRLARVAPLELAEVRRAVVDALAHLPNAAVESRLRPWLADDEAHIRATALAALGRRGSLNAAEVSAAAADESALVLHSLAMVVEWVVGTIDPAVLDRLLHHDAEAVVREALFGGLRRKEPAAARRARSLVREHRGHFAGAALAYALFAGRVGFEPLLENAAVSGTPTDLVGLGWYGHAGAIPFLLGRLESEEEATQAAARSALIRIVGTEEEEGASKRELPEADWRQFERECDTKTRYRRGVAWTADAVLGELSHPRTSLRVREACYTELRARTTVMQTFTPTDFVRRQDKLLGLLRKELAEASTDAGAWPAQIHV